MMTKFLQSWQLFKASINVTLTHRRLLWFPVVTTVLTGFIALFFISAMALPVVFHHTGYHLNQKEHWTALMNYYLPDVPAKAAANSNVDMTHGIPARITQHFSNVRGLNWESAGIVAIYFVSMFMATFFNVAFYSEIISALNGRGVSIRRGLGVAWSRLPSILAWSLLAGLVGWIIRSIEQRLPFIARIFTGLIGTAWSIAAVFVIPVIIQEQSTRNPIKILKQSATTLTRTWGEGLIGYLGFSAVSTLVFVWSLLPLLLVGGLAYALHSWWIAALGAVLWVMALIVISYISGVASHVYRCALYLYAAEGVVPEPYDQNLLNMAWKVKPTS